MPQFSNVSEKFWKRKGSKFFSFTFSKLNSKEFAEDPIVHRVSELMHAWFTLKSKVKKISCCPVNELKFLMCNWY